MRRLAFIALCALLPLAAQASVVLAMSIEQLTWRADLVVRGRVVSQQAAWTRGGRIVTTTTLEVAERLKGSSSDQIEVRHLGGRVGDVGQQVAGEVTFAKGEEVVLFLKRTLLSRPSYQVVGMAAGKFTVDRALSAPRLSQDLRGLGTVAGPGEPVREGAGQSLSLDALRARVAAGGEP